MSNFKKVLALVCSLSVVAASSVTAFADDPTSTAGTANVLAYSLESVTVPTAIKVALNPQGYAVTTSGTGDTAVTSTAQVVSFNYGIANLSTAAKDVKVSFAVTGTSDASKTPITFVDTAAEATYGEGDTNAKDGELKMYLAIVGSSAAPQTNEETPAAFAVTAKTGANEHNATATNLANVKMTAATGGEVVFAKGDDYANAAIAFKLGQTTYAVQDGETVDWTTTQAQLSSKMEPTTLGDVTGFTIKGTMNTGADWTTADVSALTFTPTYSVTDVTGDEVATTGGGYKQIDVAAQVVAPVSGTGMTASETTGVDYEATFTKGTAYDINFTGVTTATQANTINGTYAASTNVAVGTDKVTIAATNWAGAANGDKRYVKVSDGTNTYIIEFTVAAN